MLAGHTVLCPSAGHMLNEVAGADGDNALRHRLALYARPRLSLIDEIGYLAHSNRHADLLFEIVSHRNQEKSTLVTTNRKRGAPHLTLFVTSLEGDCPDLYEHLYFARGEIEDRIKEQQLVHFADRTSCHAWLANQFRLLLSGLAYTLMEAIRRLALHSIELARA